MFAHNRSGNGDANRAYTQSDSPGGSTGGQSLMPTIVLFNLRVGQAVSMRRVRHKKSSYISYVL